MDIAAGLSLENVICPFLDEKDYVLQGMLGKKREIKGWPVTSSLEEKH